MVEVAEVIFFIALLAAGFSLTALPTDLGEIVFVEPPGWYAPFRMKVVKIAGSNWTKPQILLEVRKTNRIFRRCGIKITSLELAELNFDQDITNRNLALFTRSYYTEIWSRGLPQLAGRAFDEEFIANRYPMQKNRRYNFVGARFRQSPVGYSLAAEEIIECSSEEDE